MPTKIEAKVLVDADKLDQLGAYGILRAVFWCKENEFGLGDLGDFIENSPNKEKWLKTYWKKFRKGEITYAHNFILALETIYLRYKPEYFLTQTGKRLAAERIRFMHLFYQQLKKESI